MGGGTDAAYRIMSSGRKSLTADFLGFVRRNNHLCSRLQLFAIINICRRDATSGSRESKLGTKVDASGSKIRGRRVAGHGWPEELTPELLLLLVGEGSGNLATSGWRASSASLPVTAGVEEQPTSSLISLDAESGVGTGGVVSKLFCNLGVFCPPTSQGLQM